MQFSFLDSDRNEECIIGLTTMMCSFPTPLLLPAINITHYTIIGYVQEPIFVVLGVMSCNGTYAAGLVTTFSRHLTV